MFTCCYLCFVFTAASQFITGARGQCKGVIDQMNVTKPYTNYLRSPGYSRHDARDPSSPCQWLLRAEGGGNFLYLIVLSVALDDVTNSPCTYRDRVEIHDGSDENSPLLVTLCGRTSDDDRFYSSQPLVFINFIFQGSVRVEDSMQGRGFSLQMDSVESTTKRPPNTSDTDDDDSTWHTAIGVVIFVFVILAGGIAEKCRRRHFSKPSSVSDSRGNTDTQSPAIPSAPTLASTVLYANSNTNALQRARAQEEFVLAGGDEISSPRFGGGNTDSSRDGFAPSDEMSSPRFGGGNTDSSSDGFASSDEMSSPRFGGGNTDSPRDGYVSSNEHADTGCLIVGEAPPSYESVVHEDSNAQEEFVPSGGDEISSPRFGGGNTDSSGDGFVSSNGLTDTGCLIVGEAPPSYESVVNGDCRLQLSLPVQPSEATVVTDITPKPE
ncbi:uncharacterized protein [Littorina saxatilis]|uniref:CUB domain-containing protein n=1 Tax=Littorina saxatilis TaxID=31220 RepID=A0AAN9BF85_9CAEN